MDHLKKYFPFLIIAIYFLLQLPFLHADPDTLVDPLVRGAWTDEGLYASQIRNYIDNGHFNIKENSTFVRGPLFNIIQFPFFLVFGTSLLVGRLIVLMLTLLVLYLFLKNEKLRFFGIFLSLFTLLEFHVFQFAHYSLAEMMCVDFILLSLYFILKATDAEEKKKHIMMVFLSTLFLFFCYLCKIQYLYIAVVAPVTIFITSLKFSLTEKKFSVKYYQPFAWSLMFTVAFAGLYYFLWFIPNRELYIYVMSGETGGRFPATSAEIWSLFQFNFKYVLWLKEFKVFIVHFYIIFGATLLFFIFKKKKALHPVITIFSFVWILAELHKLPMSYVPNRYFISLLFAAGVFVSSFYSEITTYFLKFKYLFFGLAIVFGIYNMAYNIDAFERRTFNLSEINNYLSKYNLRGKPVIGAWSSSVCWKCKAVTFPVWSNYFNYKDPLKTYKPAVVVTEIDEKDSDHTYKNQGLDLKQNSDSCRIFDMWNYQLALYWIKEKCYK